jgi:hypothetical protein
MAAIAGTAGWGLEVRDEAGEGSFERVGDPLRGRDRRRVPPALDLPQVLGVHPRQPVGDLIERLLALLPEGPDGGPERLRGRVGLSPARQGRGSWGSSPSQSRCAPL